MIAQRQRAPAPATETCFHSLTRPLLQRKCACGGTPGPTRECEECRKKRLSLQRKARNSEPGTRNDSAVPSIVHEVLRSPGQPLDHATRAFMEPRLGHDFSEVRVHTDARAADSSRAVEAHAYTVGRDMVFGAGQYSPRTREGRRLLAHELTHVVQQRGGAAMAASVSNAPAHEREADQIADAIASSAPALSECQPASKTTPQVATGMILARQPADQGEQKNLLPVQVSAPAEREREVEAIEVGGKSYVLYQTEVRSEGSSAWLANNPGNMDYSADTADWGAYEDKKLKWGDHRFAIFPNEQTGLKAVRSFLRKHQTIRDIRLMMNMFAPAGDVTNNPSEYARSVAAAMEVPVTALVKDLSDKQLETFALAIQRVEGWKPGKVHRRGDSDLPDSVRKRV